MMVRTKFIILDRLNTKKKPENSFESDDKGSVKYLDLKKNDNQLNFRQKSIFYKSNFRQN